MALVNGDYGIDGVKVKTPSTLDYEEIYEERMRDTLENGNELVDYNRKRKTATWGYKGVTGEELQGILANTIDTFDNTKVYEISLPGVTSQITFNAHLEGGVKWSLLKNDSNPLKRIYGSVTLKWREV